MTGAKGSGMRRTDVNEFVFYMEMMQVEKERCKFKICLSDKSFVVAFLPLPQRSRSGSRGPAWCPASETSPLQTLPSQKILKFRARRQKSRELFFSSVTAERSESPFLLLQFSDESQRDQPAHPPQPPGPSAELFLLKTTPAASASASF